MTRLDPRTKLFLSIAAIVVTLATRATLPLCGLLAGALLLIIALRALPRWATMLRLLAPMLILLTAIAAVGNITVDAVAPALKLLALGTISTALFVAVPADELADAFTLLHLPPAFSFILIGGLRYAPALTEQWAVLVDARRARGARIPRGIRALRAYASLIVPAVVRALRTADAMAEAMESRGFGAKNVTLMASYRLRAGDWLLMLLAGIAVFFYLTAVR